MFFSSSAPSVIFSLFFFYPLSFSPASSPVQLVVSLVLIKTSPSCHRGNLYRSSSLHLELMQDVREGWEILSCHEWIVKSRNMATERWRHSQFCTLRIYSILQVVWWSAINAYMCNSALSVPHNDIVSTYCTWIHVFFLLYSIKVDRWTRDMLVKPEKVQALQIGFTL